ncbi:MAG TPA: GntR family transcriptional regulator [Microbacteriaceae bacterium]
MITVDDANPMPAFEQIRSQLAGLILLGSLGADQRLPSVRQLAADLRLAPGTVARAYALLESEGLVTTHRGAGTRVSVQADNYPDVLDAALDFAEAANDRGLDLDRAILAVRAAWEAMQV